MATQAQINANRKNALKSSGPRTARGKARSRANALKHGLTGESLCLSIEDAKEVQGRIDLLSAEFCPQTSQEMFYTQRAAIQLLRLDRCYVSQTFNLRRNVRDAIPNHDKKLFEEVRAIINQFPQDPYGTLHRLRETAQGVDFMVQHWRDLRREFEETGNLNSIELERTEQLQGRRFDASGKSRFFELSRLIDTGLERVNGEVRTSPEQVDACKARSKLELEALLGRQIENLLAHRATLPHAEAELSRQEAPMRAAVDLSNAGQLLRRYENAAARELHKIFEYFDAIRDQEAPENLVASAEPIEESAELASSGHPPESEPVEPVVGPDPVPESAVGGASILSIAPIDLQDLSREASSVDQQARDLLR